MAQITITLNEILNFVKENYRDKIPEQIQNIEIKTNKIIITAKKGLKVKAEISFLNFIDGIATFSISTNFLIKIILKLLKDKIDLNYFRINDSTINIEVNKIIAGNIKVPKIIINSININNGHFTIDLSL